MTIDLLCLCKGKRERSSEQGAMAWTATILLAVLSIVMALNGHMAWPGFLVMTGVAVVAAAAKMRRNPESSSTPSASSGINYEVFLSFRGTDTRKGFTSHLYSRLKEAGIQVFKDDEDLRTGGKISQELKEAIKRSSISIAILSSDYASSRSCLMELEQMWECKESNKQTIIPIFYDISPDDVRRQAGDFEESFRQHKKNRVNKKTIEAWKSALRGVGGLSGFDLKNINGGDEASLVTLVLKRVCQFLKKAYQLLPDELVGIDDHVQEMMEKLGVVYSQGQVIEVCGEEKRVVGICGPPGVGKTTLAKVVFNKMHMLFDGYSFLEVRTSEEVGMSRDWLIADLLKKDRAPLKSSADSIKIISSSFESLKVLIVLDHVQTVEQIKSLVGELTWFGSGSRIIVTTDENDVFDGFKHKAVREAVQKHKVEPMRDHHALELFWKLAFQEDAPQDVSEYDSLSIDIVKAIGGFPSVIQFRALSLRKHMENIEMWKSTLESLEEQKPYCEDPVEVDFKARYGSLDDRAKEIFLDIACFFNEKDEKIPSYMWKSCGYIPPLGIQLLRDKYLLEIGENNELRMQYNLRDLGRKLVKDKEPGKRCRFWNHSDALSMPNDGEGADSVKGIGLTVGDDRKDCFECEEFREMKNLRYLRLERAKIKGSTENLPPKLCWLDWRACPSIPELRNVHLKELVILNLCRSPVTKDSQIWSRSKEEDKLKVLNLQGCDLSGAPLNYPAPMSLEILILEECRLSEIGPFISKLTNLSSLNLRKCKDVKKLPQELRCMESLTELLIDGTGIKEIDIKSKSLEELKILSACDCDDLKDISPIDHLGKLTSLALDGSKIDWDPETFKFPPNLRRLSLRNCSEFHELPTSIGELQQLEVMDLSKTGIKEMPPSVKQLSNLKTLKMKRSHLKSFPEDIVNLGKLEEIDFRGCRSMEGQVDCDISGLSSLRILRLKSSDVAGLPQSIENLTRLRALDIRKCNKLRALPKLPSGLLSLRWGSKEMTVHDLSYLTNLKRLCLKDDGHPKEESSDLETPNIGWITKLTSLKRLCLKFVGQPKGESSDLKTPNIGWITKLTSLGILELSLPNVTNLPEKFSALTQLRELSLSYMKEIDLTQLPSSLGLSTLRLIRCKIPEPKFSSLKYLSELELRNCDLAKTDGLKKLKLLEVLKIYHCSITDLNGLKKLRSLRKLKVFCPDLAIQSKLSGCNFELDTCT